MEFGPVDYSSTLPPAKYKCAGCGKHGCKLWRQYQTFSDYTDLLCCDCAGNAEAKSVHGIDADGRRPSEIDPDRRTDQIGWRVPAVPTEEGDTYWGYTSVPPGGVKWWRALPIRV